MNIIDKFRFLREGLNIEVFDFQYVSQFADKELLKTNEPEKVFIDLSLSKSNEESLKILEKNIDLKKTNQLVGIELCQLLSNQALNGQITERELVEKGRLIVFQTGMDTKILMEIDDLECNLFQAEDGIVPYKLEIFKADIIEYFKNIKTYANKELS